MSYIKYSLSIINIHYHYRLLSRCTTTINCGQILDKFVFCRLLLIGYPKTVFDIISYIHFSFNLSLTSLVVRQCLLSKIMFINFKLTFKIPNIKSSNILRLIALVDEFGKYMFSTPSYIETMFINQYSKKYIFSITFSCIFLTCLSNLVYFFREFFTFYDHQVSGLTFMVFQICKFCVFVES